MSWIKKYKKFNVALGLLLLLAGVGVFIVSKVEIDDLETALTNESLSVEEIWRFKGALQWWREIYFTVTLPAAILLMIVGAAMLMNQFLLSVLKDMGA